MNAFRLSATSFLLFGLANAAQAQAPAAPAPPQTAAPAANNPTTPAPRRQVPNYSPSNPYRSRTAPQPYHDPDAQYGFRNPGGVGRVAEFYPPGNTFERGTDPVRVAQFGNGPAATSRDYQMRAQSLGNQRTQTLNQHIDAYARPIGRGFGFGYGGGFGIPY